ncbi:MAG: chromate efflux transporter [Acidobacteria bacterium]|nr:chromate efflux transporter [Acidobacteriota bacterium]
MEASRNAAQVRIGDLAWTFFRVGATSYGGPAIVARIREVCVLEKGWLSGEEFEETLAFCQTLPGPIAVQTAAHIGWRKAGNRGLFVTLASYILPTFLLMLLLSWAYFRFGGVPQVAAAFKGLGAAVVGIVAQAILGMAHSALKDWKGVAIACLAAAALYAGLGALLVLLCSSLLALLLRAGRTAAPLPARDSTSRERKPAWPWLLAVALVFAAAAWCSGFINPRFPSLALVMAKVDLLAFGGGYTAVALMFDLAVHQQAWLAPKAFVDGLALSQVTPGPVIVNATFIGYAVGGFGGALIGTAAVFLPSALLLALLAPFYARLIALPITGALVRGLLAAFIALLFQVLWRVASESLIDLPTALIATAAFALLVRKVDPLWIILGTLALSLIMFV